MRQHSFGIFLLVGLLSSTCFADEVENKAQISLIANQESVQPGTSFKIGVLFQIEKGWHTYYKDPGEAGAPPQFKWALPKGFKVGPFHWPEPLRLVEPGNISVNAYKNELFLWAEIQPPKTITEKEVALALDLNWLVCADVCIPESDKVFLELPVRFEPGVATHQNLFDRDAPSATGSPLSVKTLWQFLLFAFLGGLILNAMPCVLPVISLKLFGFIRMAHEKKGRFLALGFSFVAGILLSFLSLALLVVILKGFGKEIGWGFQFQYPGFVVAMTALVFVLGLSLAGVYELTLFVPKGGAGGKQKESLGSAFFQGVLATILATPCTAPFLGVTIGFAFSQTASIILLLLMTMGLGMAFPYILLTLNPAWTKFVPKPGPWMETLKQLMAFFLFATAVWLLWVVGRQVGMDGVIWTLAFLVCLGLSSWLYGKIQLLSGWKKRVWLLIILFFILGSAHYLIRPIFLMTKPELNKVESGSIAWKKFDSLQFEALLKAGKPVFLDFTADWCLTCKVNEKMVLNQAEVGKVFKEKGVTSFKLDWTHQDPEVTAMLKRFGRYGVPLYVYYPKGDQAPPIVLSELLTKKALLEALK